MRKNRLIALIGTLTMAAAGLAAVSAGVSSKKAESVRAAGTAISRVHTVWLNYNSYNWIDPYISYQINGVYTHKQKMTSAGTNIAKFDLPVGVDQVIFSHGSGWNGNDCQTEDQDIRFEYDRGAGCCDNYFTLNNRGTYLYGAWSYNTGLSYNIKFNANTGSGSEVTSSYYLDNCYLHDNGDSHFSKTGYYLKNWNTKADGTGTSYSLGEQRIYGNALSMKDGDTVTLYAQWEKSMDDGVYLGGPWGWGRSSVLMSDNQSTANEKMVTVSLNANDGVKAVEYSSNVEQYHGASAEPTVESEAAADGYTATGHGDDNSVVNKEGVYTVYINKSTWTYHFKPLRIKYNSNGGSGSMSSTYATADGNATVSANTFTNSGNQFVEWNTQANGQGTSYDADDVIDSFLTSGENVTLYAQWEAVAQTYSVSYLNNTTDEVTNMPATETGVPAGTHPLSSQTPSRANYAFVGWNTNPDATTGISSVTITDSNVSVYAIWRPYEPHNGRWIEFSTKGSSSQVDRIAMDYSNNEWSTDAQLYEGDEFKIVYYGSEVKSDERGYSDLQPGAQNFNQIVVGTADAMKVNVHDSSQTSNDVYSGTYHITFNDGYTEFKSFIQKIQYTVTYHANNGTSEADRDVHPEVGSKFTTESYTVASFTPPTGKVFKGWNTASNGSGTSYNVSDQVEGSQYFNQTTNFELYAMWGDSVADGMYLRGSFDWTAQGQVHMDSDLTVENQFVAKGIKLEDGHSVKAVGYSSNYESWIDATSAGVPTGTGYSASVDNTNAKITGKRGVFNIYVKTSDGSYNFYPLRVNYDANNGSGDAMSPSFPTGEGYLATVSENTYSAPSENMRFNGWNTAADGSGTSYNANSTIDFSSRTEDLTLYAQWLGQVTLTYTDDQGNRTFTGYPGDAFEAPVARDKVGYTTVGWSDTYTVYPNENKTVTAVYNPINYAISFDAGDGASGGSVSPSTYNISDSAQTVTITAPTLEGNTASYHVVTHEGYSGTAPSVSGNTVTIPANSYGNFSVVTDWTPITPSVTINIVGGSYGSVTVNDEPYEGSFTVPYNSEYIIVENSIIVGEDYDFEIVAEAGDGSPEFEYTFDGWSGLDESGNFTEDTIITATFSSDYIDYALAYYFDDGEPQGTYSPEGYEYHYHDEITLPTTVLKDGYEFKGFYDNEGFEGDPISGSFLLEDDTEIHAKFDKLTYNVTLDPGDGEGGLVSPVSYQISDEVQTITITDPVLEGYTPSYTLTSAPDGVTIDGNTITIPADTIGNIAVSTTWTITPQKAAEIFASKFLEEMGKVCDEDGKTEESELAGAWETLFESTDWTELSPEAKNILKTAKPDSESSDLTEKFGASYDYICSKYKLDNNVDRDLTKSPYAVTSNNRLLSVNDISTSTWIIASVAIVGIAAVGVFFIYRKRKEN